MANFKSDGTVLLNSNWLDGINIITAWETTGEAGPQNEYLVHG